MPTSATYYGIEYDKEFMTLLNERFPKTQGTFIQGNVKDLATIITKNNIPCPDVIISTLPNSVFEQYPHLVNELAAYIEK
jgi:phospholipid N-methyltransferase